MSKKSFLATVEFSRPHKLSNLSARLGDAIGVALMQDQSDRFDEVPAYVGDIAGLTVVLMGAPEDHPTLESVLTIRMRTELSPEALHASVPNFFRCVLLEKEANVRGFIDCSKELAQALIAKGFPDCSPT